MTDGIKNELQFLDSMSGPIQALLDAAHGIDQVIGARMSLLAAPPQQMEAVQPPVAIPPGPKIEVGEMPNVESAKPAEPEFVGANRIAELPFSDKLHDDFLNSCLWIEDTLGLSAHNLICCMGFETGQTFNPAIHSPVSSATGLIQFMDSTAKRLGTTTGDLALMTPVHQLSYVYKYFLDYKTRGYDLSKWNLGDCYMAILWPAGIGKSDDYACFIQGKGAAYGPNHGLDADKNGMVTRGECLKRIRQIEATGMTQRRAA